MLSFPLRTFAAALKIIAVVFAVWFDPVFSADLDREELLEVTRTLSSADVLTTYQNSQMMLMYVELAKQGVTIQTPEGRISKRKAKKMAKEHQLNIELCEQVIQERGFQNLDGDYTLAVKGDCEGAKAWWAALSAEGHCREPSIRQAGMEITVIQNCTHEGDTFDMETSGSTLDDAIIFVEEMYSDFYYLGAIREGVITLHVDADRALAAWPSFEKPPTREALKSCRITMTPRDATAGPSATGQEKETDVNKAPKVAPKQGKSGKSTKSAEYESPNGIFSVAVPRPLNWAGVPYEVMALDNRGDDQYDKVMFYVEDFGEFLVVGARYLPPEAIAAMGKDEHRSISSIKALFHETHVY